MEQCGWTLRKHLSPHKHKPVSNSYYNVITGATYILIVELFGRVSAKWLISTSTLQPHSILSSAILEGLSHLLCTIQKLLVMITELAIGLAPEYFIQDEPYILM